MKANKPRTTVFHPLHCHASESFMSDKALLNEDGFALENIRNNNKGLVF